VWHHVDRASTSSNVVTGAHDLRSGVTKSTVVVTGAAGFVGAHVARALLQRGRRVVATDLAPQFPKRAVAGIECADRLTYVSGDLRESETLESLLTSCPEAVDVVHVAAVIRFGQLGAAIDGSRPSPTAALESLDINAAASWRLCAAFADEARLGRFLHVSTRSVFGGRPASDGRIGEDTLWQPAGIYGSSKAAAEIGLLALRDEFQLDLVIARITGVFGPWQGPVSFIGQMVDDVIAGRPHRRHSGADDAYELTYVKDTVNGLVRLLDADRLHHDTYHIASGGRLITLAEVAAAVRGVDSSAEVEFGPGLHPGASGRAPLAITRAATEVGFEPQWTLADAMADYLRVERSGVYGPEAGAAPSDFRAFRREGV
jgi:UDP-glucuronate 4-epimerase